MEGKVYNKQGKEAGKISLPESVFGLPWNADLVHEVVTSLLSSARTPVAHTKTRGEVSGTGKKHQAKKPSGEEKVVKHVIGKFKPAEEATLKKALKKAVEVAHLFVTDGIERATMEANTR